MRTGNSYHPHWNRSFPAKLWPNCAYSGSHADPCAWEYVLQRFSWNTTNEVAGSDLLVRLWIKAPRSSPRRPPRARSREKERTGARTFAKNHRAHRDLCGLSSSQSAAFTYWGERRCCGKRLFRASGYVSDVSQAGGLKIGRCFSERSPAQSKKQKKPVSALATSSCQRLSVRRADPTAQRLSSNAANFPAGCGARSR